MQIVILDGRIEALGAARLEDDPRDGPSARTYAYIDLMEPSGARSLMKNVRVEPEVDRLLRLGAEGRFALSRFGRARALHGARIGGEEGCSEALTAGLGGYRRAMAAPLLLSLLLWPLLIGIPLTAYLLWTMLAWPKRRARIVSEMRAAGFTVRDARAI